MCVGACDGKGGGIEQSVVGIVIKRTVRHKWRTQDEEHVYIKRSPGGRNSGGGMLFNVQVERKRWRQLFCFRYNKKRDLPALRYVKGALQMSGNGGN
jgi:hypothetical protein